MQNQALAPMNPRSIGSSEAVDSDGRCDLMLTPNELEVLDADPGSNWRAGAQARCSYIEVTDTGNLIYTNLAGDYRNAMCARLTQLQNRGE